MDAPLNYPGAQGLGGVSPVQSGSEGIEAWFGVEPAGAIALQLNFSKRSFPRFSLISSYVLSQGECS